MVHEVNSPTVTNVIANALPSSLARMDSGSRLRRIADATSVSRTTKLTPGRTGATHRGQRGTDLAAAARRSSASQGSAGLTGSPRSARSLEEKLAQTVI